MKEILFRVDAGKKYGYGHLSRNIALAEVLIKNGNDVFFLIKTDDRKAITKELSYFAIKDYSLLPDKSSIEEDSIILIKLYKTKFHFLVLDHYAHNLTYQKRLFDAGIKWAQFDYKATERILADIVINSNPAASVKDYQQLVSRKTVLCIGVEYTLIRNEIIEINYKPQNNHILISFGAGVYPETLLKLTSKIVEDNFFSFHIVAKDKNIREVIMHNENTTLYSDSSQICSVYSKCEVAIVAGGVTVYELAYLGMPLLIVPFVENQTLNAKAFEKMNLGVCFCNPDVLIKELDRFGLRSLIKKAKVVNESSRILIDGKGRERVMRHILSKC